MTGLPVNRTAVRVLARRLVEGRYRWGYASLRTGRYGGESIHFFLLPPDTPRPLRRCAHLARIWPGVSVVGTAVTAPTVIAVADISLLLAGGGPLAFLILVGLTLARIASPVLGRAAFIGAHRSTLTPSIDNDFRFYYICGLLAELRRAEQHLDAGGISWEQYHQTWSKIFRELRSG